jgi:hypothetical protein
MTLDKESMGEIDHTIPGHQYMKKNASRLHLKAFFFIYYEQVLNNLYLHFRHSLYVF